MKQYIKKILKTNSSLLENSQKTLCDIYKIMFSNEELILCEYNDGFRIKRETYGEVAKKISSVASGLYEKIGPNHSYIGLAIDNSVDWIIAFWAILMSGNKPYLINLKYPSSLSNGIIKRLDIKHIIAHDNIDLDAKILQISSLYSKKEISLDNFENEIAFSSSATSMNEVVCFYTGYQIAEQILNFKKIIKLEPRIVRHYKGQLKILAFLPFYHIFGLFAVYFWFTFFGRTLVFLRNYSADTILNTCKRHHVTHVFAVPLLWHTIEKNILSTVKSAGEKKYNKLIKGIKCCTAIQNIFPSFGADLSKLIMSEVTGKVFGKSVMFCINGGSYIKDSTLELLNGIGYSIYNGYGMSEIGITSVELGRKPKLRNLNSIGMPFSSVQYKINDDGILLVKGSSLCTKKLINGKEITLDDWFHTGDNMKCENGRYFILGRQSDVVIGENGENINPDSIEKMFELKDALAFSVLGLSGENGQVLSMIVQITPYISNDKIQCIREEAYSINNTLPKTFSIKNFYFTTNPLASENAVKVSRTQLIKKINNGEVELISFADMKTSDNDEINPILLNEISNIIADTVGINQTDVGINDHIFYDLGATSIQYFTIITRISEKFSINDYSETDKYCYTLKELCEYVSKHI